VLRLRIFPPGEAPRQSHTAALLAPNLFGPNITQSQLQQRLDEGWAIKTSRLSANYGWSKLIASYASMPLPLFGLDERGRLHFEREDAPLQPREGWSVTLLVDPVSRREVESGATIERGTAS
jgi:hypothetical protein